MRPTAAAPAASEPEMQAKNPQPSTVAVPKPARNPPVVASATSSSLLDSPVRTRTSPVRMNSGTAMSAKWSMPSNSDSPSREIGSTSVVTSMTTAPIPSAAQTGTASAISPTIRRTGP